MAKFKSFDYNQLVIVPVEFSKQILPGTIEYAINDIIDSHVDVAEFEKEFKNDETGAPAYYPKILLKIILYAYCKGILSSRLISKACVENIIFIALSADTKPHFTTIADFISKMGKKATSIFINVLEICDEMKLIGHEMFAIDGCKLPSNASKEWSGTKEDFIERKNSLDKKIKELLSKHNKNDVKNNKMVLHENEEKKIQEKIIHIKKRIEKLDNWINNNDDKKGKRKKIIKSNITDNESAKMKTSHGTIQGYNCQALVDKKHQIICCPDVSGKGTDTENFELVIESGKKIMYKITSNDDYFLNKIVIADNGYYSNETLNYVDDKNIDAYIPDNNFRKRDERLQDPKKTIFPLKSFNYVEKDNCFICPNNKKLIKFSNTKIRKEPCAIYIANEEDCSNCALRNQCLGKKKSKRRSLNIYQESPIMKLKKEMITKISSKKGKDIYDKRMGMIEPVFGNLRINKRMNRLTMRGKNKNRTQWTLYSMVHNIEKIKNYGIECKVRQ